MDESAGGRRLAEVLARSSNDELVGALASAGRRNSVMANAIATELLNRMRRAPFLGAFLVSLATLISIFGLDYAYTGTFLWLDVETGPRAAVLVGISLTLCLVSLFLMLAWRGRFRALRFWLAGQKRHY